MAIPSLTLRNVKGSALTFSEMDTNLQALANAKVSITAGGVTSNIALNGDTGAPTTITFANSATVQATQTGGTITLTSNIPSGGMSSLSITAGGTTQANTAFTIANSSVGASMVGNTITLNMSVLNPPGFYTLFNTDAYGRVSTAGNVFLGNLNANQNWLGNVRLNNATFGTYSEATANISSSLTGTVTIDANVAPVQTAACTGNITINTNNLTNFQAGESVTLVLRHTGNTRTFTSNVKFINGTKTIGGTTNVTDVITFFYDGTEYLAAVAKYQ